MALDHSLVGEPGGPHERSWTSTDALLYAVGVGAGLGDPLSELQFTTENSEGVAQQVLPTFAVLISRLSGDRNPLHADPKFAARGGFARPILHGLCTYGVTGRALLHTLCGSDPARFASMSGRFTRPVLPGDSLTISIWVADAATEHGDGPGPDRRVADGTAQFQTATQDGTVVIDRGLMRFRAP